MAKKSGAKSQKRRAPDIGVTPERLNHGPVERLARPIADEHGGIAQPNRSIDILGALYRRGAITIQMAAAGEAFRVFFRLAHLDPLRASDLLRTRTSGGIRPSDGLPVENARRQVAQAISAVGGPRSPGGACLWHVIGLEQSLKEWALGSGWSGRRVSQEASTGILVGALGSLAAWYGG